MIEQRFFSMKGSVAVWYLILRINLLLLRQMFFSNWFRGFLSFFVSVTPMLRNFHVDVEFFYSSHLKNLYFCRFDVEDFRLGFMFQRFLHDVRIKVFKSLVYSINAIVSPQSLYKMPISFYILPFQIWRFPRICWRGFYASPLFDRHPST